jgi:small subunit ribosomal protein S21
MRFFQRTSEGPRQGGPGGKRWCGQILSTRKGENGVEVKVFDNDVEKALKILKNKLSKSGLFKELKLRRAYEKPSVKKKRKAIEARRRLAKVQRRRVS